MSAAVIDGAIVEKALSDLAATGCATIPNVLSTEEADDALTRLWRASAESVNRGIPAHVEKLDPNESNIRVFNLIDLDPVFADLIAHPLVEKIVSGLLGRDYIVSNFSANIARPGSESMVVHSDIAAVMPSPWLEPVSCNVIWCLTDVTAENGGTLHMPGSHVFQTTSDVPANVVDQMIPFEAPAGSIMVMEGRVWHTSGRNITDNEDRALCFGYYTKPYVRPQWNFSVGLRQEVQEGMSPMMRNRLGLDASLNMPSGEIFNV